MRSAHTTLFLLVFCLPAASSSAQRIEDFMRLGREDGLTGDEVRSIAQDRNGLVWIGTTRGLNRFDGERFEHYFPDPGDSTSIPHLRVDALLSTRSGRLLIGSQDGLARYDEATNSFRTYPVPRVLPDARVVAHSMHESSDGTVWIGTWENGLLRLDPGSDVPVSVTVTGGIPLTGPRPGTTTVRAVAEDASGCLWIASLRGVACLDPETGRRDLPAWPDATIRTLQQVISFAIHSDERGYLWVASTEGLHRVERTTGRLKTFFADFPDDFRRVRSLATDETGGLWAATGGGLARFGPDRDRFVAYVHDPIRPGSLPDGGISSLFRDASGILWVGTDRQGIALADLEARPLHSVRSVPGDPTSLPPGNVNGIVTTGDGTVWVGTDSGFGTWDPASERFTRRPINGAFRGTTALYIDRRDRLWVASAPVGPCLFDRRSGSCTPWPGWPAGTGAVYAMAETPDGHLWAATYEGLFRYSEGEGRLELFRSDPDDPATLSNSFVLALLPDPSGQLWIGTESGLDRYLYAGGRMERVLRADGRPGSLADGAVGHLSLDGSGRIWIAGHGVRRLDPKSGRVEDLDPLLPEQRTGMPKSLILDHAGRAWIDYDGTVVALSVQDSVVKRFDGLPGRRSLSNPLAAQHRAADGRLYLGFDDGFYVFHPDSVGASPYPVRAVVTGVSRNGVRTAGVLQEGADLSFGPDDRIVAFEFGSTHFGDPFAHRYRFLLEGFDPDWRWSDTGIGTYTALAPGSYRLRVNAVEPGGQIATTETTLHVRVRPAWWATLWFRVLAAIAGIGVVAFVVTLRLRSIVERNRELDRLVAERTDRIAEQSEQLARQAADLLEADAAKSRFFSNVSHELRTPLTLITGYLDDMLESGQPADRSRLQRVHELAERMGLLVGQLLDLARSDAGRLQFAPKRGELTAFVRRVVEHFAVSARSAGIELVLEHDDRELWLDFDPDKIDQVLANLLGNALKFTPTGGSVWLTVSATEDDVLVRVADTGPGIPGESTERIFDRFYQVEDTLTRSKGGLGIGLSLSRDFARLHGGSLTVDSEPGSGSVFTLALPMPTGVPAGEDPPPPTVFFRPDESIAEAPGELRPMVLVVEDEPELRQFLVDLLRGEFRVVAAADGKEAWERLQSLRPDAILSDVMMPGLSGLDLLRAVRQHDELFTVPVVLLTARASLADQLEGLEAEADDFVPKPFNGRLLKRRLLNLVALRHRLRLDPPAHHTTNRPSEDTEFLERVERAVSERIDDPTLQVADVADAVFMSERTFQRRIKDLTGLSAGAHLRLLRLERARALLDARQARSVTAAAQAIGFVNVSHFARAFEQTFGVSPRSFVE